MGNRSSRPAESAGVSTSTIQTEAPQEVVQATTLDKDCSAKSQVTAIPACAEGDEVAIEEALMQCADLRRQRQQLLKAKAEVRALIAQYTPCFEENYDCEAANGEEEQEVEGDCSDSESQGDGNELCDFGVKEVAHDARSYEEVLAEQEELEDEVESLREMLTSASEMIAAVAKQSLELSEHLEEVEAQTNPLSEPSSAKASTSGTSFDDAAIAAACNEVFDMPMRFTETKSASLAKLPSLKLVAAPGAGGSEASSSTATPRSEKSSESRIASARSERGDCWVEA